MTLKKCPSQCNKAGRATNKDTISYNQYTTCSAENQAFRVACFLPRDAKNAVPSRYLADMLGFRRVRDLQRAIECERNAGAVILSTCTDGGGYFLPDSPEEIRRFIRTLSARARNTDKALESARAELRRLEGDIFD